MTASLRCVVPVGRGDVLVLAQLRGRSLVSHAVRAGREVTDDVVVVTNGPVDGLADALRDDGVVPVRRVDRASGTVQAPAASGRVVLHDPRCPLLPPGELRRVAVSRAEAAVGVRPVTDTVKTLRSADAPRQVGATVDRDDYREVCSPLALSPRSVAILRDAVGPHWWTLHLALLAAALRSYVRLDLVDVGPLGRRVEDEDALWVLECVDASGRMVRES